MIKSKMTLSKWTTCALFTALIAVGAFLKIPLPIIPFTMQLPFILLAALLMGAKPGLISVAMYLALGLIGLPIFTQGGGIMYFLKPTFGFMLGFLPCAYITGKIAHSEKKATYIRLLTASITGIAIDYIFGAAYYYFLSNFYLKSPVTIWATLVTCIFMTLPKDVILCAVTAFAALRLRPVLGKIN